MLGCTSFKTWLWRPNGLRISRAAPIHRERVPSDSTTENRPDSAAGTASAACAGWAAAQAAPMGWERTSGCLRRRPHALRATTVVCVTPCARAYSGTTIARVAGACARVQDGVQMRCMAGVYGVRFATTRLPESPIDPGNAPAGLAPGRRPIRLPAAAPPRGKAPAGMRCGMRAIMLPDRDRVRAATGHHNPGTGFGCAAAQRNAHQPCRPIKLGRRCSRCCCQNRPDLVDAKRHRLHAHVGPSA